MRWVACAAAAVAAVAFAASAAAQPSKASLRLVSLQPLSVVGQGFAARERVRVEATTSTDVVRRRVVASRAGSFRVRFDGVNVSRCDVVRVVAIRAGGGRVTLKYLPPPMCLPA